LSRGSKSPDGRLSNPRWERFCAEYARHGNATKAYKSAGYTGGGADRSAHALRRRPEISVRVTELRTAIEDGIIQLAITERSERLKEYEDRWNRLRTLREERANSKEMSGVPGGRTGLLVRTLKMIGAGKSAEVVEEYELDTGYLREIRELEKQAAIEKGHLVRRLFQSEPGILVIGHTAARAGKRSYTTLRIPQSVAARVYSRLQRGYNQKPG